MYSSCPSHGHNTCLHSPYLFLICSPDRIHVQFGRGEERHRFRYFPTSAGFFTIMAGKKHGHYRNPRDAGTLYSRIKFQRTFYLCSWPTWARENHFPVLVVQTTSAALTYLCGTYPLQNTTYISGRHKVRDRQMSTTYGDDLVIRSLITNCGLHSTKTSIHEHCTCSKFCKVVVAQSSSFRLFTTLVAEEASAWVECLIRAEFIKLKPFSEDLARKFLSSLGTQVNVEEMVQYCKGIPKLLSLCGTESYKAGINAVQLYEFYTVLRFAEKYHQRVNWKNEMNLLVAAKFGLNITHVGSFAL